MKIRPIGVLGSASVAAVASVMAASSASADFIGFTSTTRAVTGGYLINVFGVTDNTGDVILNVLGGTVGSANVGFITTNSAGGFRQSATNPVFAPGSNQSWTTLDSFLTVGGTTATSGGVTTWRANGSSIGDPAWNVPDPFGAPGDQINTFSAPSDPEGGWVNPNLNSIPATAGWFLAGSASAVQNLGVLANRSVSTSAAAAASNFGMMVAQLYVSELGDGAVINWKMGATIRRTNATTQWAVFEMTIPAPGALALLGIGGLAARRRRA